MENNKRPAWRWNQRRPMSSSCGASLSGWCFRCRLRWRWRCADVPRKRKEENSKLIFKHIKICASFRWVLCGTLVGFISYRYASFVGCAWVWLKWHNHMPQITYIELVSQCNSFHAIYFIGNTFIVPNGNLRHGNHWSHGIFNTKINVHFVHNITQ